MASNAETVDHDCAERVEELSLEDDISTRSSFRKAEFATKNSKSDLAFVFGDKKLYVSSTVIEMCSPVFEKMISEKVKNEQGLMEIEIPGCSDEDFDDFLTCFYPGKQHEISDSSVFRILPLAHQFEVKAVIQLCENRLLYMIHRNSTSPGVLSECMSVAYSFNLETVKQQAFDIYKAKQKRNFKEICIPFPKNIEAKADILEECLPRFILTENKYAFSSAFVPFRGHGIDMADFDDARYAKRELSANPEYKPPFLKLKNSYGNGMLWGITFNCEGLWNNLRNDKYIDAFNLTCEPGSFPTSDSSARMAVLYRIHNASKAKNDIFLAKQFTANEQNISEHSKVTIDSEKRRLILEQCILDGMFSMTVHILMNKPGSNKTTK